MLAGVLLDWVSRQLLDTGVTRTWADATLLGFLSDAQREVVSKYPAAHPKRTTVSCVAGARQTIPADGVAILRVIGNASSGRALTAAVLEDMDASLPGWKAAAQTATPYQYLLDSQEKRDFLLYPPVSSGVQVDIIYAPVPVEITARTDAIALDDAWKPALQYWMLAAAHAMEHEDAEDSKAASYYALFDKAVKERTL